VSKTAGWQFGARSFSGALVAIRLQHGDESRPEPFVGGAQPGINHQTLPVGGVVRGIGGDGLADIIDKLLVT